MIDQVINFLREHLNANLHRSGTGASGTGASRRSVDDTTHDAIVFLEGGNGDAITFQSGAVTLLLINVEEARELRAADRHRRSSSDGTPQRVQPEIQLNLYVLFVARFKEYSNAWAQLSAILGHFQSERVITAATNPNLPAGLERLTFELQTLSLAEQNELWSTLRTTQLPSLLYKVRAVTFVDDRPREPVRVSTRDDRVVTMTAGS